MLYAFASAPHIALRRQTMIVWLASYPRSGNSYLRTVIYTLYGLPSISAYKKPVPEGSTHVSKHAWKKHTHLSLAEMSESDETFLVKTHDLPPEDGNPAIYVVRDGRSSVVSYANLMLSKKGTVEPDQQSYEFQTLLRQLMTDERSPFGTWSQNVKGWVQRPNTAVIRFEELIRSTDCVEIAQNHLNLGWQKLPGAEMPPFEALKKARPVSFRRGSTSAWKAELSPELQELFVQEHGAVMEQMGYQPQPSQAS
jgi:hypothetical protein